MKNLLNLKHIFALLILAISVSSCETDKDKDVPAPDLATRASGKYIYSELSYDGQNIPADESNLKGDIRITKKTETTVDAVLNIRSKSDNSEFMVYNVSDIDLHEASGNIDLVYDGERVAQIIGKKIVINAEDDAGVSFTLSATR